MNGWKDSIDTELFSRTVAKVYRSEIVGGKVLNNRGRLYFTGGAREKQKIRGMEIGQSIWQ